MNPKSNLYLPMAFWSSMLATLDLKIENLSKTYGFGQINLSLIIHNGKVTEIYLTDEVRIRGLLEKYQTVLTPTIKNKAHPLIVGQDSGIDKESGV